MTLRVARAAGEQRVTGTLLVTSLALVCMTISPPLLVTSARAEALVHQLEARVGAGSVSVREEALIPYAFTGPALQLAGRYGLSFGRHTFTSRLDFGAAPLWTRGGEPAALATYGTELGYRARIRATLRGALGLGAVLRFTHEYAYLFSWDDAHGYWLDALVIGPALQHVALLTPRLALEIEADLAALGIASRSPARRLNKQDALSKVDYHFNRLGLGTRAAWPWDPVLLRLATQLRFRRARERGYGIGVELRLARAAEPVPYTSWYCGVTGSYRWSWP